MVNNATKLTINNIGDSEVNIKEKILLAIRKDSLVYIANGTPEKISKIKESFQYITKAPMIEVDVPDGIDIKDLRENVLFLNETFKHLINKEEN